eukprot:11201195-Karenia_brevis.AAC.1
MDANFVTDHRGQPCHICAAAQESRTRRKHGTWKLGEVVAHPQPDVSMTLPIFVCTTNSHHTRRLTEGEEDLLPGPMSPFNIRLFMEMLWEMNDGMNVPSPAWIARRVGLDAKSVTPYYN